MNNVHRLTAVEILQQLSTVNELDSETAFKWLTTVIDQDKWSEQCTKLDCVLRIIHECPAVLSLSLNYSSDKLYVFQWLLKKLIPVFSGANATKVQYIFENIGRILSKNVQSWLDANRYRNSLNMELSQWTLKIDCKSIRAVEIVLNLVLVQEQLALDTETGDSRFTVRQNERAVMNALNLSFTAIKHISVKNEEVLKLWTLFLRICNLFLSSTYSLQSICSCLWLESVHKWISSILKIVVNGGGGQTIVMDVKPGCEFDLSLAESLLRLAWISAFDLDNNSRIFVSPNHSILSSYPVSSRSSIKLVQPNLDQMMFYSSWLVLSATLSKDVELLKEYGSFKDSNNSVLKDLPKQIYQRLLSLSSNTTNSSQQASLQNILISLNLAFDSLEALSEYIQMFIQKMSEEEKIDLIRKIGYLSCHLSGTFRIESMTCMICDNPTGPDHSQLLSRQSFKGFQSIFTAIITSQNFSASNNLRIETMLALKRVLVSFQPEFSFNSDNEIGAWLMTCLTSTFRDVRILSGSLLPFLTCSSTNVDNIFRFLSSININRELYLRESTVTAWTELAQVLEGEHLNFILMKLIDFLGSDDFFLNTIALHELQKLAKSKKKSIYQLCTPFWNTISVQVVKTMSLKLQLLNRVSDALEISPAEFLSRTLSFTIPYLVMARSYDIVESIAVICNYRTAKKIYLDHVANIMAVLFSQNVQRPELFAENRWFDIDESFRLVDFAAIIWPNHLEIIVEILKLYQEENESKTTRLFYALNYIGSLKYGDKDANRTLSTSSSSSSSSSSSFGKYQYLEKLFNENLILQLVTKFSDTVRNVRGKMSYTSKLKSLNGIAMMIRCAPSGFYNAIPLICTLLQSALETDMLQLAALYTWSLMLQNLDKTHLGHVIDLTLCVIIQKWTDFTLEAKQQAFSLVEDLFTHKGADIKDFISSKGIPSLMTIPGLRDLESLIGISRMTVTSPTNKVNLLLQRCNNENIYVIRQTVIEIREFLTENQDLIAKCALDKSDHLVATLLRVLLNEMYIFRNIESDIPNLCAHCIGLIGAVDHHFVNINEVPEISTETTELDVSGQQRRDIVVVNNFAEAQESIDFVIYLMEEFLVKIFRASTDPNLQMFLAYGIQEYLKFCGLNTRSIELSTGESQYWRRFSYITKSTLVPLLSSKYTAPSAPIIDCEYPIFNQSISYSEWLHDFTYDLLSKAKGGNVEKIFGVFRRIMRGKLPFQSMISFLLPFAALNVYLEDNKGVEKQNILQEIRLILNASPQSTDDLSEFYRTVFSIVDYFSKWNRAKKKSKSSTGSNGSLLPIDSFLSEISPELMALRSFECKSYARAIMYWEQYLRGIESDQEKSQGVYDQLRQIYSNIGDSDSLEGIFSISSSPSIEQQIVQYEAVGKWDFALECYEALKKENETWDVELESNVLHCLKESGRYEDLLTRLEALVPVESLPQKWVTLGIEVSWLAGNFLSLEKWLSRTAMDSYEINVGRAFLALRSGHLDELGHWIISARANVSSKLSSELVTSLSQCVDSRVRLHALADLESIGSLLFMSTKSCPDHRTISNKLDRRLDIVGSDYNARRYLLSMRRSLFAISDLDFSEQEIGITWIKSSRDARKQNQIKLAIQASLRAMMVSNPIANVEYAKILWSLGEQRKATSLIEELRNDSTVALSQRENDSNPREQARIALLHTKWLDESAQKNSEDISTRYRNVCKLDPTWEKAYYALAQYFNKVMTAQGQLHISMRNSAFLNGTYVKMTVLHYYKSLQFGCKYAFETLPRMITIWLDFSENLIKPSTNLKATSLAKLLAERRDILTSINNTLKRSILKIPTYILYLALSQLLSRITHSDKDVLDVILLFIVEIAKRYPRQALWSIYGVVNSKNKDRNFLGREVIMRLRSSSSDKLVNLLLSSAANFTENMIKICNFNIEGQKIQISLSRDVGYNKSMVPCDLVVPVQSAMQVVLPSIPDDLKNHTPFPDEVTVAGFEDSAVVQQSLQRPKRIVMIGSNGHRYKILCKPHDDVRKDARLMEFTSTVDKLLLKDNETSKRLLRIKTYHVTPLNEDCGLIEWIDGAIPIRSILFKLFTAHDVTINWAEAKKLLTGIPETKLLENFKRIKNKYFPILYEWFLEAFPEPSSWLLSRSKFSRSTAVMSMLGYILGLGDRHGENLLLLNQTGEVLHVDFDCLFDKGLELEMPERVPFRLTEQMVNALGAAGYEGVFRKSAEVTLQLLREHEEMLMTNLETFLHDPIVDWSVKRKRSSSKRRMIHGLMAARSPEEALTSIRHKIKGIRYQESIPLSVSGQVEYLILQATADENLSKMYIGWAPFL